MLLVLLALLLPDTSSSAPLAQQAKIRIRTVHLIFPVFDKVVVLTVQTLCTNYSILVSAELQNKLVRLGPTTKVCFFVVEKVG